MAAGIVILGLIAVTLASAIGGQPSGPLPGVALGSAPLLLVERAVAFFAAWMLVAIILVQALRGHLPTEISGRGVSYASAEIVGESQARAEEVGRRHDYEIAQLRETVTKLEKRVARQAGEID